MSGIDCTLDRTDWNRIVTALDLLALALLKSGDLLGALDVMLQAERIVRRLG